MSMKTKLQTNNTDLQSILDTINALPEEMIDAYAVINVTYPEGSVCTCSNENRTLELDNTLGYGFFLVDEGGEWTVSCTDGTNSKSQSVSITAEGQFESVTLSYRAYLVKSKTPLIDFADPGSAAEPTITSSSIKFGSAESAVRSSAKVDCTEYTKLVAEINVLNQTYNYPINVLVTDKSSGGDNYISANPDNAPTNTLAYKQIRPATKNSLNIITVDISSVTGLHYIGVATGYCPNATIQNLYFE